MQIDGLAMVSQSVQNFDPPWKSPMLSFKVISFTLLRRLGELRELLGKQLSGHQHGRAMYGLG